MIIIVEETFQIALNFILLVNFYFIFMIERKREREKWGDRDRQNIDRLIDRSID